MSLAITDSAAICRLLADATRQRLLLLLDEEELSVAELTEITGLSQSRVSTHLARLREAAMICDRRQGTNVFYGPSPDRALVPQRLWQTLRGALDDSQVASDRERMQEVLRRRQPALSWAESVAGQMELHYSPGRTWQATAHSLLPLLDLGDVLDLAAGDGMLASLLAPHCHSITCVDISARLVAAGRDRLARWPSARYLESDMHALPLREAGFDTVFLLNALTYTRQPEVVLAEAARVLRPGGQAIISTLLQHEHQATVANFDHVNLGFKPEKLKALLSQAGLNTKTCEVSLQEPQPPYFSVLTAVAFR